MIFKKNFFKLGTDVEIRIILDEIGDGLLAEKDFEECLKKYDKAEDNFSRFNDESLLSRVNGELGRYFEVNEDFLQVCKRSIEANKSSQAYFDPRILSKLKSAGYVKSFGSEGFGLERREERIVDFKKGLEKDLIIRKGKVCFLEEMDFSGIVKGYITDKASLFLKEKGWKNFFINSGGDAYFFGFDEEEKIWTVGISDFSGEGLILEMKDCAIATSGISKRKWSDQGKNFHHLINPKNENIFSTDLRTVSVISQTTEEADVWAKALFLMGKEKGLKYSDDRDLKAVFIDSKGNAFASKQMIKIIKKDK